ncbi:MAG: hypothetical protein NXH85_01475 [Pseudomonadaceae bacterium]|nr:hypothetical protein [Pseudomonadaceae bacterium]
MAALGQAASATTITLTADREVVQIGDVVEVDILVANETGSTDFGLTVEMVMPANLNSISESFVSGDFAPASSCDGAGATTTCTSSENLTWQLGDLAAGEVRHMSVPFVVAAGTANGTNISFSADLERNSVNAGVSSSNVMVDSTEVGLDLALLESSDPVSPAEEIVYEVIYGNASGSAISSTTLALDLPGNASFVSTTGGGVHSAGVVTWNLNTIAANEIGRFEVRAVIASPLNAGTVLIANATIDGDRTVTETASQRALSVVYVDPTPSLQVDMQLASNFENDNTWSQLRLAVGNPTGSVASGVSMVIRWPGNAGNTSEALVSGLFDDASSCSAAGATTTCSAREQVIWNLGDIAAGEVAYASIPAFLNSGLADGTIREFTVLLTGGGDVIEESVAYVIDSPAFSTALISDANPVASAESIQYDAFVGNVSGDSIDQVSVTLELPAGTSFVSTTGGGVHSNGVVTWDLNTIPSNFVDSFRVEATVSGSASEGELLRANLSVVGDLSATQSAFENSPNVSVVSPDEGVDVSISVDESYNNDNTFSMVDVVVSNSTASTLFGVTATMRWPTAFGSVSENLFNGDLDAAASCASAGATTTCSGNERPVWALGDLGAGESRTFSFPVFANSGLLDGNIIPFSIQTESSARTIVEQAFFVVDDHSLDLTLSSSQSPVSADEQFSYRVSWGNVTASNLSSVELELELPSNVSFVSASDGGVHSGGVVTWTLNSVASGEVGRFEVTVASDSALLEGELLEAEARIVGDVSASVFAKEVALSTIVVDEDRPLELALSLNEEFNDDNAWLLLDIAVANASSETVFGAELELRMPLFFGNVSESLIAGAIESASCDQNGATTTCSEAEVIFWNLGDLAPGESTYVSIPVFANPGVADATLLPVESILYAGDSVIREATTFAVKQDSVSVTLSESADPIASGDVLTYRVRVGNVAGQNIDDTEVSLALPDAVTFQSATDGGVHSGGVVTWSLASFSSSDSRTLEVDVQVAQAAASGTLLEATATVSGERSATQQVLETSRVVTEINDDMPLRVEFALENETLEPFGAGKLYALVSNDSASTVFDNSLEIRWPDGLNTLAEALVTGAFDDAASCFESGATTSCTVNEKLVWNFGDLAAGQTARVSLPFSPGSLAEGHTLLIAGDLITGNRRMEESLSLLVQTPSNRLSADVLSFGDTTSDNVPIVPGALVTYVINFSNISGGSLAESRLIFPLPDQTTLAFASNEGALISGQVEWNLETLANLGVGQVKVTVRADGGLSNGEIIPVSAWIDSADGIRQETGSLVHVDAGSPIALDINSDTFPATSSQLVDMSLTATNVGTASEFGVEVRLRVPGGLNTITEASIADIDTAASCNENGATTSCTANELVVWSLGTLLPGESRELSLSPTVAFGQEGEIIGFDAEMSTSNGDLATASYSLLVDSIVTDTDGDGIDDRFDNCFQNASADQRDNELDGIGNNCDSDDDNDGLTDVIEINAGTDPFDPDDPSRTADSDGDGLADWDEVQNGCSRNDPDTDGDGILDVDEPGTCTIEGTDTSNIIKLIIFSSDEE